MNNPPIFFAGSSHVNLAKQICSELHLPLGQIYLSKFPDGETHVQILENVQERNVFVLQSIAGEPDHYLFELLIIIDALKRASAKTITAIIPYFSYCRQDRKNKPGEPITAKLVANVLAVAGMTRLLAIDLHSDQVEGFFETPVEHLGCQQLLGSAYQMHRKEDCIVVAPDIGSVKIAERMAKFLGTGLAVIQKERLDSFSVQMTLIGNVKNKNVLIVDDLCSTGGTLVSAAQICKQQGALKIDAAVTHGLFVERAIQKIEQSALDNFFVTDSVAMRSPLPPKIKVLPIASMIVEAIHSNFA